jgi:hypothetical protein
LLKILIKNKFYFIILLISLGLVRSGFAQQSKLSKSVNYLSEYIASDYFKGLSKTNSDLDLVDSIYLRAVKFNCGDVSEALFDLTFAVIPYNNVPIKIPLIGVVVNFHLVCATDSIYNAKNKNLPKNLFGDTPKDDFGDKDKLAHFFGSAFLSYSQNIFDLTDLIGYFVEYFEEAFEVQSSVDLRDIKADHLGKLFGEKLKREKNALPSVILRNKTLN